MASYMSPNPRVLLPSTYSRYPHPHPQCIHAKPKIPPAERTPHYIVALQQEHAATQRLVTKLVDESREARDEIKHLVTCAQACWKAIQPHMQGMRKDDRHLEDAISEVGKSLAFRDSVLKSQLQTQHQEEQVSRSEIRRDISDLTIKVQAILDQTSKPVPEFCPPVVALKTRRVRQQSRSNNKKAQSGRSSTSEVGLRRSSRVRKPCR